MRKLNLAGSKPASDDLVGSLLAGEKAAVLPSADALTPRVLSYRFRDVRNPATGALETILVESTAPNAAARARMAKLAANMTEGCPWSQVPYLDAMYLLGIARIIVQAPEIGTAHAWLLDNPGLVQKIREVLEEHDQRYFCGVDASGHVREDTSRMERPYADPPSIGSAEAGGTAGADAGRGE